ncbi:ABC-type transport auxiliary lipoprotein family protein [Methylocella sp.]|uniref:ABC-type transport auxiliary lipoprotein family protein n=1 Tax=Methylocella sp. TaxID=1978226 RepID=UPI003783C07B
MPTGTKPRRAGLSRRDGVSRGRSCGLTGALLVALALSACASAPPPAFDLEAARGGYGARQARRAQIAVAEPAALPLLDGDRIVVRRSDAEVAYLSGAQWSNRLPQMLQARLIASFQNASLIRAVVAPGLVADYELRSQLRRFDYDAARGVAEVEIAVQIFGAAGRIVAGKVFVATAPASGGDPAAVVAALNAASADVMRQIVLWTAPKI